MLRVIQIPVLSDNYIYLIVDESSGKCACVDPAVSKPVVSMLKKKNLFTPIQKIILVYVLL